MTDDAQLLHQYAAHGSEPAFGEFVRRHVGWVYHAALRRAAGRHDLAQEIAQYVFTAAAESTGPLFAPAQRGRNESVDREGRERRRHGRHISRCAGGAGGVMSCGYLWPSLRMRPGAGGSPPVPPN